MIKEIQIRQSIRKYQDREVEKEKLVEMLKAAMRAPSASNRQSWRFIVVEDQETLKAIKDFSEYTKMLEEAKAAIIVLGDLEATKETFAYVDTAAAIENMLLEACELGLGTCWCAIGPNEEKMAKYREYFKIKDTLIPTAIVAIGYPNEVKPLQDRFDEAKITWWK